MSANSAFAKGCDRVLIIYADNFSTINLSRLLAFHETHNMGFTIVLFPALDPRACGIAETDSWGTVINFVEKPQNPKCDLANAGIYVWDAKVYREVASMSAYDIGHDVLPRFVGRMKGYRFDGFHRDIGTMEALRAADDYVRYTLNVKGAIA